MSKILAVLSILLLIGFLICITYYWINNKALDKEFCISKSGKYWGGKCLIQENGTYIEYNIIKLPTGRILTR